MYSHRPKCNSQTGFLKGHTKSKKCYIGETIWEPLKERNNSKISLQSGSNFKSHERTDSVTNKNGTKRNLRKK